jgi:hypothetical protein
MAPRMAHRWGDVPTHGPSVGAVEPAARQVRLNTMIAMAYRAGLLAVALASAPLAGCGGSGSSCSGSSIDYGSAAHGATTPRAALTAYLRTPPPGLPSSGWHRQSTVPGGVAFRSGPGKVELVRVGDGSWLVDGYTVCR